MSVLNKILICFLLCFPAAAWSQNSLQHADVPLECRVLLSLNQPMPKACKRVVKAEPSHSVMDSMNATAHGGATAHKNKGMSMHHDQMQHPSGGAALLPGTHGMHAPSMQAATHSLDHMSTAANPHTMGHGSSHSEKTPMTIAGMANPFASQTDMTHAHQKDSMHGSDISVMRPPPQRQAYLQSTAAVSGSPMLERILSEPLPPNPDMPQPMKDVSGPLALTFERSTVLTADARVQLDQLARQILSAPARPMCLLIEGHADSVGNDAQNMAVSQRRAEHVRNLLMADIGTLNFQYVVRGAGESRPMEGITPQDARNRRVEIYGREGFDACI